MKKHRTRVYPWNRTRLEVKEIQELNGMAARLLLVHSPLFLPQTDPATKL